MNFPEKQKQLEEQLNQLVQQLQQAENQRAQLVNAIVEIRAQLALVLQIQQEQKEEKK